MDRCRKCKKPLMLGPSACSNCGEPLFGMNTSPAINVPASTVQTHDSGMATGGSQSTITTPTYTTSTSADGMHQDWTPTSTGVSLKPLRWIRRLLILAFVGYWLLRMFGGMDDAGLGGVFSSVSSSSPSVPSVPSIPSFDSSTINAAPEAPVLPVVPRLQPSTKLPNVTFEDGEMRSASILRIDDSASVNFMSTGSGSKPTRSVFMSAGIDGSYPTVTAQNSPRTGVSGTESGELPLDGSIALGPSARFAWRVVEHDGIRVVDVTVTHGSKRVVLNGGGLQGSRATASGQSPLSYEETGIVADYFRARLDG